jgi:hypothetical protein
LGLNSRYPSPRALLLLIDGSPCPTAYSHHRPPSHRVPECSGAATRVLQETEETNRLWPPFEKVGDKAWDAIITALDLCILWSTPSSPEITESSPTSMPEPPTACCGTVNVNHRLVGNPRGRYEE